MSLVELHTMASELGLEGPLAYYYSTSGVNGTNGFVIVKDDMDAMNLSNFVDENRMVGVYVENLKVATPSALTESDEEHSDEVPAEVAEGVEFMGQAVEGVEEEKGEGYEEEKGKGQGVEGVGWEDSESVRMDPDVIDNNGTSESEGDQSMGSDSDYSEKLNDSECEISDDDVIFESNVDEDIEWAGLPNVTIHTGLTQGSCSNVNTQNSEEGHNKHKGHPIFNLRSDCNNPTFELGMCFNDAATFSQAVRQHSINHGRDVKFTINDKYKVQAKCKHPSCNWVIYASKVQNEDTMQIKTYHGKHQCPRLQKVSHATSRFIAQKYKDKIWSDPTWPINSMMKVMQKDIKLQFNKHQMYRAKKKVLTMESANDSEEYGLLWSYAEEIKRTNPSTTVKIKAKLVGGQPHFKRLYICWGALRKGLLDGCRPVIFLDECHLKTCRGGILLCAIGIDANNGMYPFAYAIVEKEKTKSWNWFLKLIAEDLNISNPYSWTFVSDKQKGLVDALESLLPGSEHRFCVQHLYQNFKQNFKGLALKNLLWKAARTTKVVDFEKAMLELKERDKAAFEWLAQRPPNGWSKSHFSTHSKCDMLLNNMCESFNAIILRARSMHVVSMLEIIRLILMKRIHVRRDQMQKFSGGEICPKVLKLSEEQKKRSMEFVAHWNGQDQFEIENCFGTRVKVHLRDRTCTCRKWELNGIPCAHAISALYYMGYSPEEYVHTCYKKDTFLSTYSNLLGTLNGMDMWPKTDLIPLLPPICERMPGRPKKHKRRKAVDEVKVTQKKGKKTTEVKLSRKGLSMTCSLCQSLGHNARGCPTKKASQQSGLDLPAQEPNELTKCKRKRVKKQHGEGSSKVAQDSPAKASRVTRNNSQKEEGHSQGINEKDTEVITPTRVTRSTCINEKNTTPQRVKKRTITGDKGKEKVPQTSNTTTTEKGKEKVPQTSNTTTTEKGKEKVPQTTKTLGVRRKLQVQRKGKKNNTEDGPTVSKSATSNTNKDEQLPNTQQSAAMVRPPNISGGSQMGQGVCFSTQIPSAVRSNNRRQHFVRDMSDDVPMCTQQ